MQRKKRMHKNYYAVPFDILSFVGCVIFGSVLKISGYWITLFQDISDDGGKMCK
jgi:hypothetical protein